jgi:ATP-binding cassette, subfamily B (MDR/TAP), member 1
MTGVTNHMSVIQDAIGEKVMVEAMHNTNVRFCCQTSTKLTSLQLGHFVASFSTFFATTIIAFISCWEVAMLSFLVIPLILFIGATYTKKMNGISLSRITTISEAISVVEQVLLYQLTVGLPSPRCSSPAGITRV